LPGIDHRFGDGAIQQTRIKMAQAVMRSQPFADGAFA
jgi:hypothetical protein